MMLLQSSAHPRLVLSKGEPKVWRGRCIVSGRQRSGRVPDYGEHDRQPEMSH
jgi:hypothetical protein